MLKPNVRIGVLSLALILNVSAADPLLDGFRNPPVTARPSTYYLLLNGYVNRDYVEKELAEYQKAGIGGLCLFDMGARGPVGTVPPAGPAFLSRNRWPTSPTLSAQRDAWAWR